jgi:phosphatidylglycerol:prolipoprotein diacylglycerol transferase
MLWYFRKNKLPTYKMLDIMAVTTCLVHFFGRIGCFMAGCCHGKPTGSFLGVTFTNEACYAPLHIPLFPTQLMEAGYILCILITLWILRNKRTFYGQLFLIYIMLYAIGRSILEIYRGDSKRGFVVEEYLSHSQLIAGILLLAVLYVYHVWSGKNKIIIDKKQGSKF